MSDLYDIALTRAPLYQWTEPARRPFTCPVCGGRGHVPNGFYNSTNGLPWVSTSTLPEQCRACFGRGLVWE